MGLFDSISKAFNPSSLLGGGGGGGGGSSSFDGGGIGSTNGNTTDTGNTSTITTTTTTSNWDKRQAINSGAVGVTTDTGGVTIHNTSSDPDNFAALLAVTDHLAGGTLALMAANMDMANQAAAEKTAASAIDGTKTTAGATLTSVKQFIADHKPVAYVLGAVALYLIWKKV